MAENNLSESDKIQHFINITGTDEIIAKNMLEAFNNNLEMAINMFLEGHNPDQQDVHEIPPEAYSSGDSSSDSHKRRKLNKVSRDYKRQMENKKLTGGEHNGVIIDDDDEDEVRAPIPQRQEILVEDQYHAIPYQPCPRRSNLSVFNACRDFRKESEEYEEVLKNKVSNKQALKRKRLHELFQPPVDLIHLGDFQSARDVCNAKKKWLLVNIQNSIEFACQVVNRDVWSNQTVRDIINANFIMWQVSHDSDEGLHYATFYTVKKYPHMSVIDPRTGERLIVWENFGKKPSPNQFAELATLFLSQYPNLNESVEVKEDDDPIENKSVIDLGEEDQLEVAITASLTTANESKSEMNENSDSLDCADEDADEEDEENDEEEEKDEKDEKDDSPKPSCDIKIQEMGTSEEQATILLRLPDNGRKQILFSLDCTLKELSLELSRLGWPDTRFEIIKAFPRQNISQLSQNLTLKEAGLHRQETLFVQDR